MAYGEAYTFGNNPPYHISRYYFEEGMIQEDGLVLGRPSIDSDDYHRALEDINEKWSVIKDPRSRLVFEVAIANQHAPLENGIDVELSTFTSSISGNPGNAVELAENASLHPERRRLYLASLGNGQSSYWSKEERAYIRKTGRYIKENGEPLPTIESLTRALEAADLIMTRCFSTNSAGGAYATALMAALPEGQITHAYLKSRPNISNHRPALIWGLRILIGDILDDQKYRRISSDPWKLTGELVDEAKTRLPSIYSEEAENRYKTIPQKARSSHKITKLLNDLTAFSRGGPAKGYPAELDTIRALKQQPRAIMTYHFPMHDRVYNNMPQEAEEFLQTIYALGSSAIKASSAWQLEALVLPGKHRDHTQYPGLRWAVENYAFNRTLV